jgi:hypothetical protein
MKRWGIALAAGMLLGAVSQGRAQIPTGVNGLTFVPINTQNLSTPLPYSIVQTQPTFRDHVHGFFHRLLPGFLQPKAPLPGPMSPITQLPNIPTTPVGTPSSPTFTVPIPVSTPRIGANIR